MNKDFLYNIFNEFGSPMYFFDEDYIEERVAYIRDKMPENINICYAVKANTFLTKVAARVADRIEVCSPGEYRITKRLGIEPSKLVISGVYKTPEVMEEIISDVKEAPVYTAESVNQYLLLRDIAKRNNVRLKLLLRLTSNNQFGMREEDIREIVSDCVKTDAHNNIDILGIHYFSGTQKHSQKLIQKELTKVVKLISNIEEDFGITIEELEYGGGFPVYYFEGESFEEEAFFEEFTRNFEQLNFKKTFTLELGRSIAAGSGYYQTKVVDIKSDKYVNYCILDGGINHLAYYGQTMGMRLPHIWHISSDDKDNAETRISEDREYVLCGSLCTVNDVLVKQIQLNNVKVGDYLVFNKVGAYSITEGIGLFLTRELPGVVLFSKKNNTLKKVREITETDILNCPDYSL